MSTIRGNVLTAKKRLADGYQEFLRRHQNRASGRDLCLLMTNLRDAVLLDLYEAALTDLGEDGAHGLGAHLVLVAHGGYGRRDVAPFSDVDLMLLHARGMEKRVAPLADRMLRDVFDAGLTLGHSVRTVDQACQLAATDPQICTSLMESRFLTGSNNLFQRFTRRLQHGVPRRGRALLAAISKERQDERIRYGETVFLLEPNVKRSRGGLRDLQFMRWIGYARYGATSFRELEERGAISLDDRQAVERAYEFLLWLRNELHFHAHQAADVLGRADQLRIADMLGYPPVAGMMPVEQFMRDYFRHTGGVSHIAARMESKAMSRDRATLLVTALFGHVAEPGIRVGPAGIVATRQGLEGLHSNLTAIIRLVDLANLYDAPIAPGTWEHVRREAAGLTETPDSEACRHFISLLDHPARLAPLLRDLHDAGLLERFIPEFAHARGLLQFNQYHKYTVDEHCLRAVEFATELRTDDGPLGRTYRSLPRKHVLHLALLLHDLGKGHLEDHREIGKKIAERIAARLQLPAREAEMLRFLVHKHEMMNHLAFRRDTSDAETVLQFAVKVGSPEMLEMLYVLTACDLGAVGPGVWDGWKSEIVADLFHRAMQVLAVESPSTTVEEQLGQRREEVRAWLGEERADSWFEERIESLPPGYLSSTSGRQVAADLRLLRNLPPKGFRTEAQYQPETGIVQITVATSEEVTPGIFHKLTGGLSSQGLEIRDAQINTLPGGLVLDRFWLQDPDFTGPPPPERLEQVQLALARAVSSGDGQTPTFRRTWRVGGHHAATVPAPATRVSVDNSTSQRFTVIDVFARDRTGLLYTVTRTLFELQLSVWRAKIATYSDQVVDVFYVTDQVNGKIEDEARLETISRRLVEVIDGIDSQQPVASG
ncbi:MAG: [protein-PII] uridylyltransferase [Planctomycetota bacterium]